jgi:hypothetical protein
MPKTLGFGTSSCQIPTNKNNFTHHLKTPNAKED